MTFQIPYSYFKIRSNFMEKYYESFKNLTEKEELILSSDYIDFLFKYRKRFENMSTETIVSYYLEFNGKSEVIDKMLQNMNNVMDLIVFAKNYNRKILMLKKRIREGNIKEIYCNLEKYRHLTDVYRIKEFLRINGFNEENLPDEWLLRITTRIDIIIDEEKMKNYMKVKRNENF